MLCASCGAAVPVGAERCDHCGRAVVTNTAPPRLRVPQPERYRVEEHGDTLTISWSWFSPVVFVLLPFGIAWWAFLIGWYSMVGGEFGEHMPGPMRLIFLVFPLAHVAVGVGLAYGVATMLANRTWVQLDDRELRVTHGPIYFPGVSILREEIDQLYVGSQPNQVSTPKAGLSATAFSLRALLRSGHSVTVLRSVHHPEEALFLEQRLETALGLADRPVGGEVAR